jgi:hypothetical protein
MTCLHDCPPTHAEIAVAAYYLWLNEVTDAAHLGGSLEEGCHLRVLDADENWFIAERYLTELWHYKRREEEEIHNRCPEL